MIRLAALMSMIAVLAGGPSALAQGWRPDDFGGRDQDEARAAVHERRVMPLQAIVAMIGRRSPGQLLSASGPADEGGRLIYHILWDARGQQVEYVVDARTGELIR